MRCPRTLTGSDHALSAGPAPALLAFAADAGPFAALAARMSGGGRGRCASAADSRMRFRAELQVDDASWLRGRGWAP